MSEFLRVYFSELGGNVTGRTAYNRAESWHVGQLNRKKFKSYESFRTVKSRYMKRHRNRLSNTKQITRQEVFAEALSYISPELQRQLKEKWQNSW